jgi:Armadillo/beta-catenin-like repeat
MHILILSLYPFLIPFSSSEIDDELKTKITDTIYIVMNAHLESSDREPRTFGRYRGRALRRIIINADAIHAIVRLLSSDEPPVLRFASWALGSMANESSLQFSIVDAGPCRPLVALLRYVSIFICAYER